jgi:hypothetical protein
MEFRFGQAGAVNITRTATAPLARNAAQAVVSATRGTSIGLNLLEKGIPLGAGRSAPRMRFAAAAVEEGRTNNLTVSEGKVGLVTVYRGDRAGVNVIKSYAARKGGYGYSADLIKKGNIEELMISHANNSTNPASPFISVTSDVNVARFFAGSKGTVREIQVPANRAFPNRFNNMLVPAGPGGALVPEAELLVPNYIRPSEIIKKF